MRSLFWILLCIAATTANAAELNREARIKKRIQLRMALVHVEFCEKELGKTKYQDETAFFFNQNFPGETNARLAKNKLTPDEKVAYEEFLGRCDAATKEMNALTDELRERR